MTEFVISRGEGAFVEDSNGKKYVDLTGSSGANVLGHRHPSVVASVVEDIQTSGTLFDPGEGELLHRVGTAVLAWFPAAQAYEFFRTGSCANTAAVLTMRAASGNDVILTSGYHGWHPWMGAARNRHRDVIDFEYDLEVLDRYVGDPAVGVAGVIVTPQPNILVDDYWRELAAIVQSRGTLLAFDEVLTGIRYGLGGFQKRLGVSPDLTLLSKGLANGFGLSVLLGSKATVSAGRNVNLGGTYRCERTPFAAAAEVLHLLRTSPVLEQMTDAGRQMIDGLNAMFASHAVNAAAFLYASDFYIVFSDPTEWESWRNIALAAGVLVPDDGNVMVTAAHSTTVVEETIERLTMATHELVTRSATRLNDAGRLSRDAVLRSFGSVVNQLEAWGNPQVRELIETG